MKRDKNEEASNVRLDLTFKSININIKDFIACLQVRMKKDISLLQILPETVSSHWQMSCSKLAQRLRDILLNINITNQDMIEIQNEMLMLIKTTNETGRQFLFLDQVCIKYFISHQCLWLFFISPESSSEPKFHNKLVSANSF